MKPSQPVVLVSPGSDEEAPGAALGGYRRSEDTSSAHARVVSFISSYSTLIVLL